MLQKRPVQIRGTYQPQLPRSNPKDIVDVQDNINKLLRLILEDATGSLKENVRVWPIRASYYRAARRALMQYEQMVKEFRVGG